MSLREVEMRTEVTKLVKDINNFTNNFYLGDKFNWTDEVTAKIQEGNQVLRENNNRLQTKALRQALADFACAKTFFFIIIKRGIFSYFLHNYENITLADFKYVLEEYNPKYMSDEDICPEQLENLSHKLQLEKDEMKESLAKLTSYLSYLNYSDKTSVISDLEKNLNNFKKQAAEHAANKLVQEKELEKIFGF